MNAERIRNSNSHLAIKPKDKVFGRMLLKLEENPLATGVLFKSEELTTYERLWLINNGFRIDNPMDESEFWVFWR